jgi:transcriptional regulator with XRE-family HTH domain
LDLTRSPGQVQANQGHVWGVTARVLVGGGGLGDREEAAVVKTEGVAAPAEEQPGLGPGLVRRARRAADLSQRDLARRLAISQSTVARWETGESSPTLRVVEQMMALSGLRLEMTDARGARVAPMREDAARDQAGRRLPAHVDPHAFGWWVPRGLDLTVEGIVARRRAAEQRIPGIRYDRGRWRGIMRRLLGTPDDHPTRAELVSAVETRIAPH